MSTEQDTNKACYTLMLDILNSVSPELEVDAKPQKKPNFWQSIKNSTKFLFLMIISSFAAGFLLPKGAFMPEHIVLPYAICKFLWSIGAMGWAYSLVKETRSS